MIKYVNGVEVKLTTTEVEAFNLAQEVDPVKQLNDKRSRMSCTSLQGKIALGSDAWTSVLAYRDEPETPFSVKVTIDDSPTWNRLSQDISLIGWALDYTDEQMDELFVKAMKINGGR